MEKRKRILVLGATGSIGKNALDVIRHYQDRFTLAGASAHNDGKGLETIANEFKLQNCVLSGVAGQEALLEMIRRTEADIVVNGIAGASGLLPSKAALESGKHLALANKETIVMAGLLIRKLAERNGLKILPVDSEHSAVFNLIEAYGKDSISEIILTASGGPFREWDSARLAKATAKDALKHPTWTMGSKITIDSASLANKGLEVIEACRLFDVPPDRVKVVVHPQSLVHSFIRTKDGVLYAQVSPPDMRHPILSALSWPDRLPDYLDRLDFDTAFDMRFEPPRYADFPLLGLAFRAAGLSGRYTIAFNAANEEAVYAFADGRISFPELSAVTAKVLENDWSGECENFDDVLESDAAARILARGFIGAYEK
jgi:1-deoxy-D-xylulose-5-phosphate reductoisomerase